MSGESMKICLVTNLYPPLAFGGATGVAQIEAEELVKRGYNVFVITTSETNYLTVEWTNGVKVYRLPPYNVYPLYENFVDQSAHSLSSKILWHMIDTFNFKLKNKISRIILDEKPDVIHFHNFKGLSLLLFRHIRKLGLPIILTAHDYTLICPRANLLRSDGDVCKKRPLICSFYSTLNKYLVDVDVLISPSDFLIRKLKEEGFSSDAVRLPNLVEINEESSNSKTYDKLDILYVGELSRHKGVHILIKAFNELDNATLTVYGRGPYEQSLKKISNENLNFQGYAKGFDELKYAYNKANVTVVPSIGYENLPMVVYESFAHSTPVIGSDIGGIPELVIDGYNGFLFEPGDKDELKGILKSLSEDPSILKEFERNAYESAKNYTIKEHLDKLERIYRGLL